MSVNAFQNGIVPFNAISEKWSKVLLKNLSLVGIYKHIAEDHSSELSDNSDAIHLRIVNDESVTVQNYYSRGENDKTAGTQGTIDYKNALVNKITLELTDTPYSAIKFEDYALRTSDVSFQAKLIDRAKYYLSKYIDTMVMNTIIAAVPVANTVPAFDATAAGEGEMFDVLLQISAILKNAGAVPVGNVSDLSGDRGIEENPYVVVNPDVMRYILKEPAFVKVDMQGNAMWKDGLIRGTIAGLIVLESSNLPTTGGQVNVFGGVKFATHYAVKKISDRMVQSENTFEMLWSVLIACGCVVSHPQALAKCVVRVKQAG